MRVLLPPSEAKRAGGRGRPVGTSSDGGPLADSRRAALHALGTLLAGDAGAAARALALPAGVAEQALAVNRAALTSPTTAALRRYTGIVYAGLDLAGMDAHVARAAGRGALVFSGLWGVLRGDEPVPDYRVPAKAVLPGLGTMASWWRPILAAHLPTLLDDGLVVDLRSVDYSAMWRPIDEARERTVTVRVLSPLPRGGLGVISYASKLAKGRLAAALFARVAGGGAVENAADVLDVWRATGATGEVESPNRVIVHAPASSTTAPPTMGKHPRR